MNTNIVGRLTRSLPLSRPNGLSVYVARVPAAPFCETPTKDWRPPRRTPTICLCRFFDSLAFEVSLRFGHLLLHLLRLLH